MSEVKAETEALLQAKEALLPSIVYEESLKDAPYSATVNPKVLGSFLKEFGLEDERITGLTVRVQRNISDEREPVGWYGSDQHLIKLALDPYWSLYQNHLNLARELSEGRKNPDKAQFRGFLYTKRLPQYLASAPPERGLQFAGKLLADALNRANRRIIFHESRHAMQSWPKFGNPLIPTVLISGLATGYLMKEDPEAFLVFPGIGASVLGLMVLWKLWKSKRADDAREKDAYKFDEILANDRRWRSIIKVEPKQA